MAFRQSGVTDFVRNDIEGLLVGDDREMLDALISLTISPVLRAKINRHYCETAPCQTWAAVVSRADQLYDRAGTLSAALAGRPYSTAAHQ